MMDFEQLPKTERKRCFNIAGPKLENMIANTPSPRLKDDPQGGIERFAAYWSQRTGEDYIHLKSLFEKRTEARREKLKKEKLKIANARNDLTLSF